MAFEAFELISLSDSVTPSITADVFAVKVVNVPASGVVPPITVLSTAPPLISALAITTCPVPLPVSSKFEFDAVVLISLSVILILLSMHLEMKW